MHNSGEEEVALNWPKLWPTPEHNITKRVMSARNTVVGTAKPITTKRSAFVRLLWTEAGKVEFTRQDSSNEEEYLWLDVNARGNGTECFPEGG